MKNRLFFSSLTPILCRNTSQRQIICDTAAALLRRRFHGNHCDEANSRRQRSQSKQKLGLQEVEFGQKADGEEAEVCLLCLQPSERVIFLGFTTDTL